jgi:hypothetical protein
MEIFFAVLKSFGEEDEILGPFFSEDEARASDHRRGEVEDKETIEIYSITAKKVG